MSFDIKVEKLAYFWLYEHKVVYDFLRLWNTKILNNGHQRNISYDKVDPIQF